MLNRSLSGLNLTMRLVFSVVSFSFICLSVLHRKMFLSNPASMWAESCELIPLSENEYPLHFCDAYEH